MEVVVHALPAWLRPTDGTDLWLGILSGLCSNMVPSFVGRLCDWAHLLADIFGSPHHDMDLGGDDMAPL